MLVVEVKVEFTSLGLSAVVAGIPDELTLCKDVLDKEVAGVAFDALGVIYTITYPINTNYYLFSNLIQLLFDISPQSSIG